MSKNLRGGTNTVGPMFPVPVAEVTDTAASPEVSEPVARTRKRMTWSWVGAVAPHVPVALSGLVMLAVLTSTWDQGGEQGESPARAVARWVWHNAQPLSFALFALTVAYTYTPWARALQWLRSAATTGWTWRILGLYAAGLAAGTAALLACLELGGGSRWMVYAGVLNMVAVVSVFALAAHWQPEWETPPVSVGAWAAGLMLLVPAWLALCNLATKF